jgi:hypothetical protein
MLGPLSDLGVSGIDRSLRNHMTKKFMLGSIAVAIAALTILANTANAGPFHPPKKADFEKVDFQGGSCATCTVSYSGGVFSAQGNITQVVALPSSKSLNVSDGSMSIVTGSCDVKNCSQPNGKDQLVVGFTNSSSTGITIMGLLPGMLSPQVLMTGELEDTVMVLRGPGAPSCAPASHAKGLCGPDTGGLSAEISTTYINQKMLQDLGLLPANQSVPKQSIEQLNFDLNILGALNDSTGTIDGPIVLTDIIITTPEPNTLLLFGSSFIIAAWILRKKLAARP